MSFSLEQTGLWRHVERTTVSPSRLKAKEDDCGNRMEKIFAREKKIYEFQDNAHKAVAKIRKMCTDKVQTKFLSVKALREWTPKELWNYLKT